MVAITEAQHAARVAASAKAAAARTARAAERAAAAQTDAAAEARPVVIVCGRCGGALVWDDGRDWWRVLHLAGCRLERWQPCPPGVYQVHAERAADCETCGRALIFGQARYCSQECKHAGARAAKSVYDRARHRARTAAEVLDPVGPVTGHAES